MNRKIYHYHLTIGNCTAVNLLLAAKSIKAKPTSIDLYNNKKNQIDRMVTKYGSDKDLLIEIIKSDIIILEDLGFDVVRIKLEEVVNALMFDPNVIYSEAHIKVYDNDLKVIPGMKLSKNNLDKTKFYNARINNEMVLHDVVKSIKNIPNIISAQYELVHIDTNVSHDEWW
jgi:hypothetical protein